MLDHLELFHKYMTDKISVEETKQLEETLKVRPKLAEEFTILTALKEAVRRNLLTKNMNYLKHIEQTLKEADRPAQSKGKIISFLMSWMGSCA